MPVQEKKRQPKPEVRMPPEYGVLTLQQVAFALSISLSKLHEMISTGEFPKRDFSIGDSPRWTVETLREWIAGRAAKG